MSHSAVKSFLGAGMIVLATVLIPLTVQAQNTNTTLQKGWINLNLTSQRGDSSTNTTSQTGLINLNRTIQLGGGNASPAGPSGWFNPLGSELGRGFQGIGFDRGGDTHGDAVPSRAQHWGEGRRDYHHHHHED